MEAPKLIIRMKGGYITDIESNFFNTRVMLIDEDTMDGVADVNELDVINVSPTLNGGSVAEHSKILTAEQKELIKGF